MRMLEGDCVLRDDDSLLDAGPVFALSQGRPQVRPDLVVLGVRVVKPDVQVWPEVSVLVLDVVGWHLQKRQN